MSQWTGRMLSKVLLIKRLAQGGMADVYLGHHTTLDRPVAVKILHGFLAEDEVLRERFRKEAQGVACMRHPNILQVLDFDILEDGEDTRPYIVMELLQGMSLDRYLVALPGNHRLPAEIGARLVMGLSSALDYAHSLGIVHRDIKPANIFLRYDAGPIDPLATLPVSVEPVLTDFGLARFQQAALHTTTGGITGTPAYISPEQARGLPVDGRADIYSLGVVIYEMLIFILWGL
jgi:serine/threonine protein kinase